MSGMGKVLQAADGYERSAAEVTGGFSVRDLRPEATVALVVEDDSLVAYALTNEIQARGMDVVIAATAADAMVEIATRPIAFAIVDHGIGCASDMVLEQLRARNVDRLIYSGLPVTVERRLGADAIVKPGLDELRSWLDKRTGR